MYHIQHLVGRSPPCGRRQELIHVNPVFRDAVTALDGVRVHTSSSLPQTLR